MMSENRSLFTELTDAEGAQVQGGLSWFGNVVIPGSTSNGYISAYIDRTPGGFSGVSVDIPDLRPILGLFGLTKLDFLAR
jgi:hypothetical protein